MSTIDTVPGFDGGPVGGDRRAGGRQVSAEDPLRGEYINSIMYCESGYQDFTKAVASFSQDDVPRARTAEEERAGIDAINQKWAQGNEPTTLNHDYFSEQFRLMTALAADQSAGSTTSIASRQEADNFIQQAA